MYKKTILNFVWDVKHNYKDEEPLKQTLNETKAEKNCYRVFNIFFY